MRTFFLFCAVFLMTFKSSFAQSETPLFRFGAIADVQYCDCDAGTTRFYRNSPAKLEAALTDLADEELSFMVHLGDVIDKEFDSYGIILPYFESVEVPLHFALGNHEFSVADSLKDQVPEMLGLDQRYYDFAVKGWRFIVTDGNDQSLYAWPEGSANYRKGKRTLAKYERKGVPQAQKWNGGIGKKQLKWIQSVLEDAAVKEEKVILFSHFPIAPAETHNLWNDKEVVALLESFPNVVAWMSGHNHKGGYTRQNGIYYLIMHGMVETESTTAYSVVVVYADRIEIQGVGREPTRILGIE